MPAPLDTESLRLFVLAADKLNISAAGRILGMAPAVASAKLAKLENAVGADLLHRSTRKVSLSLEGSEFLPYAKEILAQERAARAALGQGSDTAIGTLRFTASSTFAEMYIAPLLPEFLLQQPGINLELRLSDSQYDLIEGSFDLALRNSTIADSSLKGRKLADDNRILCASPDYLAQYGTPETIDDLNSHQLLGFSEFQSRTLTAPDGSTGLFAPAQAKRRLIIDNGASQKVATVAGSGISLNSIWSIHQELRDGKLVQVLPDHTIDDKAALWLLYPKSNVLTAKVRIFMDFLLEKIGKRPVWEHD